MMNTRNPSNFTGLRNYQKLLSSERKLLWINRWRNRGRLEARERERERGSRCPLLHKITGRDSATSSVRGHKSRTCSEMYFPSRYISRTGAPMRYSVNSVHQLITYMHCNGLASLLHYLHYLLEFEIIFDWFMQFLTLRPWDSCNFSIIFIFSIFL